MAGAEVLGVIRRALSGRHIVAYLCFQVRPLRARAQMKELHAEFRSAN